MKYLNFLIASLILSGCTTLEDKNYDATVGKTYVLSEDWCAMSPGEEILEMFPANCSKWEQNSYWKKKLDVPAGTCIELGRTNIQIGKSSSYEKTHKLDFNLKTYYYVLGQKFDSLISDKLLPSKEINWPEIKETTCQP